MNIQKQNKQELTVEQAIRLAAKLLGLNKEGTEYSIIAALSVDLYPKLSGNHIMKAFKLYLNGDLDDYFGKYNGQINNKHFNNFSAEFYTKVINAYRKYHFQKYPKKPKVVKALANKSKEIEAKKFTINEIIKNYENYCNDLPIKRFIPHIYLNYLKEIDLIDKNYKVEISNEAISLAISDVLTSNVDTLEKKSANRMGIKNKKVRGKAIIIEQRSKVFEIFKDCKEKNIDLKTKLLKLI